MLARLLLVLPLVTGSAVLGSAGPAAATGTDCVGLVVDSAPGSYRTGCVSWTSGLTGLGVLQQAGHTVQFRPTDGLICRVDGVPATCAADATHYWSYWHRAPGSVTWSYSTSGASSYQPARGSTEGWAYQDGVSRTPANVSFSTICPPPPPASTTPAAPQTTSAAPPSSVPSSPPASTGLGAAPASSTRYGAGLAAPPRTSAAASPSAGQGGATAATRGPTGGPAAGAASGSQTADSSPPAPDAQPAPVSSSSGNDGAGSLLAAFAGLALAAGLAVAAWWRRRTRQVG